MVPGRTNQDFFANAKAAGWWHLQTRFQITSRAIVDRLTVDPDDIISLATDLPELAQLLQPLSQPSLLPQQRGESDGGQEVRRHSEPGPRGRGDDRVPTEQAVAGDLVQAGIGVRAGKHRQLFSPRKSPARPTSGEWKGAFLV
jgi:hypothetical protein